MRSLKAALERAQLEADQAKILMRELSRAEAEGLDPKLPGSKERDRQLARQLPRLSREEAYKRFDEHMDTYSERARSRKARSGARRRGDHGTSRLTPAQILAKSKGACYLCGQPITRETLHIEHVIPISRGGKHTDENLGAACPNCNLRKGDAIVAFDVQTRTPIYLRAPL